MAFTKESLITNYEKAFDYSLMRNLVAYAQCWNAVTQIVAIDGTNKENIQATGAADLAIAGVPCGAITADAEYLIATEPAYAVWAAALSYVAVPADQDSLTEVFHVNENEGSDHYACILAHTSTTATEPGEGADWRTYWRKMDQWAEQAVGDSIAAGFDAYYLVCADSGGFLKVFKAYSASGVLQIPAFDPTRYAAVALWQQDHSSGSVAWVMGTTEADADSSSQTITQILGSTYPDAALIK